MFTKENAAIIINQLAGSQRNLVLFTGANNFKFSSEHYFVSFKIGSGAKKINNKTIKYVKITLNSADLYDIEFGGDSRTKNEYGKFDVNYVCLQTNKGVYGESLKNNFETVTGFYLSFH